jgi:hypothetical protein
MKGLTSRPIIPTMPFVELFSEDTACAFANASPPVAPTMSIGVV